MNDPELQLYPLEMSLHRIRRSWGGWPGKVGEIWSLSGPPHESIVLNGALAGQLLTKIVGTFQQRLLGPGVELDPREPFPIFLKFISTREDLPLQVHPNDPYTLRKGLPMVGRDKIWYILKAGAGARVYLGFREEEDKAAVLEAIREKRLRRSINAVPVRGGEAFSIPPGRVHAAGRGVILAEIQRHSHLTFELTSGAGEGRKRAPEGLEPEEALEVMNLQPLAPKAIEMISVLAEGGSIEYLALTPRFLIRRLKVRDALDISFPGKQLAVYTGLKGTGWLKWGFSNTSCYLQPFQSVIVPAVEQELFFETDEGLEVLETSLSDLGGGTVQQILHSGIALGRVADLGGEDYCRIIKTCL
ncbi:MAG: hypothetical protein JW821_17550 [Deltaproteobacteria bacterium]|nr:hypothetical protein [Deltaproteobacteria bacterium]